MKTAEAIKKMFYPKVSQNRLMETNIIEKYSRQMAENHAFKIDENFWMVVKQKPKWMPNFIYKAVIKELVEFQKHNIINPSPPQRNY